MQIQQNLHTHLYTYTHTHTHTIGLPHNTTTQLQYAHNTNKKEEFTDTDSIGRTDKKHFQARFSSNQREDEADYYL